MDGLEWKTLLKMDDLAGKPTIFGNIQPYIVGIYWIYLLLRAF